jgi:hypothetical protein
MIRVVGEVKAAQILSYGDCSTAARRSLQLTPSFLCRSVLAVVYWKRSLRSG